MSTIDSIVNAKVAAIRLTWTDAGLEVDEDILFDAALRIRANVEAAQRRALDNLVSAKVAAIRLTWEDQGLTPPVSLLTDAAERIRASLVAGGSLVFGDTK